METNHRCWYCGHKFLAYWELNDDSYECVCPECGGTNEEATAYVRPEHERGQ